MKTIYLQTRHVNLVADYANFHRSGSIAGMKRKFYGAKACLVRCGPWIYNVPLAVYEAALRKGAK